MCGAEKHNSEDCPEWSKPVKSAEYLGSASQGLGLFHIDITSRSGRLNHWNNFDNCAVFTIEEGNASEEEIVENFKSMFDASWKWHLNPIDEYIYLVRFPPQKKLAEILMPKVIYFYLKNGVMGTLRIWNGDGEPFEELTDVWVKIKGIPPKYSDADTFKQVASTLGKLEDIDWSSLFTSFFASVRLKIAVKDKSKIPARRVMEFEKKLYVVRFKCEGQEGKDDEGGSEDKFDDDEADDLGPEEGNDKREDTQMGERKTPDREGKEGIDKTGNQMSGSQQTKNITVPLWTSLFKESVGKCVCWRAKRIKWDQST